MLEQLHKAAKYLSVLLLISTLPIVSNAQDGNNPFDIRTAEQMKSLTNSTRKDSTQSTLISNDTGNPFDIIAPPPNQNNKKKDIIAPIIPTVTGQTISLQEKGQNFLFVISLSVLLLLTILVTLSRNLIIKMYQSFYNDVILRTLYRERGTLNSTIYTALYIMYLINISVFIFLALYNFNHIFNSSEFFTLFYSLTAVSILFVGKNIVIQFLSSIFPISKEITLYGFIMVLFGILIGLILAPINVFLAYADPELAKLIIIITSLLIGSIYIFRSLRSLILAQNYIIANFFHFLLYLCVIEIAPIMILLKIVSDKMQLSIL